MPFLRLLDIEHEMTNFAFYYVGIAAAVFLLGYFQVGLQMSSYSTKRTDLKRSESAIHLKTVQ